MQIEKIIFHPAAVFLISLLLGGMALFVGRINAARSEESEGKHKHYSCGEDLEVPSMKLSYHAFFRLALLFGILHIVALVITTIPTEFGHKALPLFYLLSAGICMSILLERDHEND